mmetsp:Transcript_38138/g.118465  ORF Transcript_38138/g.118465 Transcript_38138/m.118465 type:complete len:236 (+) Transcript_38138:1164-1871(+)
MSSGGQERWEEHQLQREEQQGAKVAEAERAVVPLLGRRVGERCLRAPDALEDGGKREPPCTALAEEASDQVQARAPPPHCPGSRHSLRPPPLLQVPQLHAEGVPLRGSHLQWACCYQVLAVEHVPAAVEEVSQGLAFAEEVGEAERGIPRVSRLRLLVTRPRHGRLRHHHVLTHGDCRGVLAQRLGLDRSHAPWRAAGPLEQVEVPAEDPGEHFWLPCHLCRWPVVDDAACLQQQ